MDFREQQRKRIESITNSKGVMAYTLMKIQKQQELENKRQKKSKTQSRDSR